MQILLSELEHGYRYPQQRHRRFPLPSGIICSNLRCRRPIPTLWHGGQTQQMIFLRRLRYRYAACPQTLRSPRFARLNGAMDQRALASPETAGG